MRGCKHGKPPGAVRSIFTMRMRNRQGSVYGAYAERAGRHNPLRQRLAVSQRHRKRKPPSLPKLPWAPEA
jgi:hypothetical protein